MNICQTKRFSMISVCKKKNETLKRCHDACYISGKIIFFLCDCCDQKYLIFLRLFFKIRDATCRVLCVCVCNSDLS